MNLRNFVFVVSLAVRSAPVLATLAFAATGVIPRSNTP